MRIRNIARHVCQIVALGAAFIGLTSSVAVAGPSEIDAPEPSTTLLESIQRDAPTPLADELQQEVFNTASEPANFRSTLPVTKIDTPAPFEPQSAVSGSVLDRYRTDRRLPELAPLTSGIYGPAGPPIGRNYQLRSLSWIQVDYLLWWMEGQYIPELARSSGATIVGNERLDADGISGVRIRGGHYFDCEGDCGLMYEFFGFGSAGSGTSTAAAGVASGQLTFTDMDLSIPANTNGCACLAGLVGTARTVPLDSLSVRSSSDVFSGGLYGRSRLNSWHDCCRRDCCCNGGMNRCGFRWDVIYGYRYFGLDEDLSIASALSPATGAINAVDSYSTSNDFNGVDLGLIYEADRGRWGYEVLTRIALGVNRQRLRINGTGNLGGGVFAQYTNIGRYEHDHFTAIPEVNLTASYNLTCNLRARFGYSFMWISNVVRPGRQVDTRVDGRFFDVTQPRPLNAPLAFFPRDKFETESLWLQGINAGFEYWY